MPIKVPDKLPAIDALLQEGVRVMTEGAAVRQDIRPLQIGLLNLMPNKIKTELQLARLLGASPLQVEMTLVRIGNHKTKTTNEDHLLNFYQTWEETKARKFDGFIITGAPVETIPYEEVTYWREMQQILDWTNTHVHSLMAVCWGAMASFYHFHGIDKHALDNKAFGVFKPKVTAGNSPYLAGFSDNFAIPISRWAEIRAKEVEAKKDLTLTAASQVGGVSVAEDRKRRHLYVLDHLEYDSETLADEYFRDVNAGTRIKLPENYFPDDDPAKQPKNSWRSHGYLLFSNWINEIYQTTPFDIDEIGKK